MFQRYQIDTFTFNEPCGHGISGTLSCQSGAICNQARWERQMYCGYRRLQAVVVCVEDIWIFESTCKMFWVYYKNWLAIVTKGATEDEQSSLLDSECAKLFDANLLYVLMFDAGFQVAMPQWTEFLASIPVSMQGTDSLTVSSSQEDSGSHLFVSDLHGAPKTDRSNKRLRSNISKALQQGTDSEGSGVSHLPHVNVNVLLRMLQEKNDKIQHLSEEKKCCDNSFVAWQSNLVRNRLNMKMKSNVYKPKIHVTCITAVTRNCPK